MKNHENHKTLAQQTDKPFGDHYFRCPKSHRNDEKALNFEWIDGRSEKWTPFSSVIYTTPIGQNANNVINLTFVMLTNVLTDSSDISNMCEYILSDKCYDQPLI